MAFAYADKYGLLHVVDKKAMAEQYAKPGTKVVQTIVDSETGTPKINGQKVFVYLEEKEAYIGSNAKEGQPYKYQDNPVLMALINDIGY